MKREVFYRSRVVESLRNPQKIFVKRGLGSSKVGFAEGSGMDNWCYQVVRTVNVFMSGKKDEIRSGRGRAPLWAFRPAQWGNY